MDKKELGTQCRDFRKSIGYTVEQVANESGYTKGHISNFERGRVSSTNVLLWYLNKGMEVKDIGKA